MNAMSWSLACSECAAARDAGGLPTVCPDCGAPWLVEYPSFPKDPEILNGGPRPWSMWRYREWMPLAGDERPVSLGEGMTPLLPVPSLARALDLEEVWVKDEAVNATGSFKARGLSAAVTRAAAAGAKVLTAPTAGNAGVALSAYGRRAGLRVKVFAPETTPATILRQIRTFGAELELIDGHIGDCGKLARAFAAEHGAFDVSTLREPYRIEGKKTLGLEIAERLHWHLPDAIVYPTGGGTGLIGMWKAFNELRAAGWVRDDMPRLYSVQSSGCAPVVRGFEANADHTEPWENPVTVASGLRVPAPLGGKLILRAIRETRAAAVAVSDADLVEATKELTLASSVDACPEGGATLAALKDLVRAGSIGPGESVVLFNTGAGWLYR